MCQPIRFSIPIPLLPGELACASKCDPREAVSHALVNWQTPNHQGQRTRFPSSFFQHLRELQAHWHRLRGRLRLASADDAVDYGSGDVDLTIIEIHVGPPQAEQFALTKTGSGDSEDQELGFGAKEVWRF